MFQSTPLMRGATSTSRMPDASGLFQSTPLMRGATKLFHRPIYCEYRFNPRPSCEGRHGDCQKHVDVFIVSIHAPHARGDQTVFQREESGLVSIHAPHARGDRIAPIFIRRFDAVSIHAPHARGDQHAMIEEVKAMFHSTPLMRGATTPHELRHSWLTFQSTPLMRGATSCGHQPRHLGHVSIHAPHARGDAVDWLVCKQSPQFQSTPLMRGATYWKG